MAQCPVTQSVPPSPGVGLREELAKSKHSPALLTRACLSELRRGAVFGHLQRLHGQQRRLLPDPSSQGCPELHPDRTEPRSLAKRYNGGLGYSLAGGAVLPSNIMDLALLGKRFPVLLQGSRGLVFSPCCFKRPRPPTVTWAQASVRALQTTPSAAVPSRAPASLSPQELQGEGQGGAPTWQRKDPGRTGQLHAQQLQLPLGQSPRLTAGHKLPLVSNSAQIHSDVLQISGPQRWKVLLKPSPE